MKKISIFYFNKRNFSTFKIKTQQYETDKFLEFNKKTPLSIFEKGILTHGVTFNIIHFCSKYREMSNISKLIRPLLISLNSHSKLFFKSNSNYLGKFFFINWIKKKIFFDKLCKLMTTNINFKLNNLLYLKKYFENKIVEFNSKWVIKKHVWNKIKKMEKLKVKQLVNAFLTVRSTWNNFFVTISDSNGHTLITRSGGMGERTASRQRASVFSADSAVYEACFLAKKRGVESLNIHVRSTFWLPQIRNSFDGLEASGLEINELLYRPKLAFGGCRQKKPRRV